MEENKTEIFVSYAWGGDSEAIVNEIELSFKDKGIDIVRDKSALDYRGPIKPFMEKIGKGKFVIVIISKKYLESKNCMYEMLEITKNDNWNNRIFPVVMGDANIYDAVDRIDYIQYWTRKTKELNAKMKEIDLLSDISSLQEELQFFADTRRCIDNITNTLSDMNALTPDIHQSSNFQELYKAINKQLVLDNEGNGNEELKPLDSELRQDIPGKDDEIKGRLRDFIARGKLKNAIDKLLEYTENRDSDQYNSVVLLSGRYSSNKRDVNMGVVSSQNANMQQARLINALLGIIDEL